MGRVFVVGAHVSRGGAYIAYHVGRIIAGRLGLELVAAQVGEESPIRSQFDYPDPAISVPVGDMLEIATADDVLVCNPSYSARFFGVHFPGRSVMYVQNVNTYSVIDGFIDHYVACSSFVRDHLALHYGFDVPVIVPFVHVERIGEPRPFQDRPAGSVAVVVKTPGELQLELLERRLAAAHPDVDVTFTRLRGLRHDDVLEELQRNRYLLTLSAFEGHPLVPLEAMLSGCCVVGFHGGGGLEYLRPGLNAEVVGYPRIDDVTDALARLVRDPQQAGALAARGRLDVGTQTYDTFVEHWTEFTDHRLAPAGIAAR